MENRTHPAAFPQLPPLLTQDDRSLRHHVLIAMPQLSDGYFSRSVIYVCAHSAEGAMGIVINQALTDVDFSDLVDQLQLPQAKRAPVVHFGGPVETGRGFVLHSTDFERDDTVRLTDGLSLTGTVDILRAISEGRGPNRAIFALGYAGWGPGQLEAELQANAWLTVPADEDLIFSTDLTGKWDLALGRLGVSPFMLALEGGRA